MLQTCSSTYKCPCDMITQPPPTPDPDWWCTDTTLPVFNCERAGRFADLRDNNCKQYFLCSKFHNDTWIKASYTCQNSVFDPVSEKCNADYTCPCAEPITLSTTTIATTTVTSPTTTTTTTTPTTTTTTTAPTTTTAGTTTFDYLCTPDVTNYVGRFQCSKIGRYPDLGDEKCQKYFLCSKLRNDTWVKTRYACSGSTFDPTLKKCSIHYNCPCEKTTITELVTTTEKITTTQTGASCVPSETLFECSSRGRFPDLNDVWCKKYFLCTQLQNGTWLQTNYSCSGSSFFDPTGNKCSSEYSCPCVSEATTTASAESTTISVTTPTQCSPNAPDFDCTSKGRFPNPSDLECRTYSLCSQYQNGTWVKKSYKCIGSTFDPKIQKCSITYLCPCAAKTIATTPKITISTLSPTTLFTTCAPPSEPLPDFSCTDVGRFPDLADPNCKKYFLCSLLHNGTWIKTRYSCKDSNFAPEIEKCHISYPCPCLTYYTTPMFSIGQ